LLTRDMGWLTFQLVVLHQEIPHLLQQFLWGERVQAGVSQVWGSISWGFTGTVPLLSQAAQRLVGHSSRSCGKATNWKYSCPPSPRISVSPTSNIEND
jgi:hypothetical protein